MSEPTRIHIFRPGRHPAMSGVTLEFSEADLQATAAAYDPALHEAPLVVGHPAHDGPAYGWVRALNYGDDGLQAEPDQLDPAFAELVSKGRFKKISASFYAPEAAGNPKPGVYYLRHVGFLGAQPPAVKGLKPVEFAADEAGIVTVEFAEVPAWSVAAVFRGLREFLISKFDTETADQVVPSYVVDDAVVAARTPTEPASPAYADPHRQETSMTPEEIAAREAELEREHQALATQRQEIEQQQTAFAERARTARNAEILQFVEQQVAAGRVLPRDQAGLVAFMQALPADQVIEFGEGADAQKPAALAWLQAYVSTSPVIVDYAERGAPADDRPATRGFDVPPGAQVDPQRQAQYEQALAYAEQHNVDFITAAKAVEKEH